MKEYASLPIKVVQVVATLLVLVPIAWMVGISLKPADEPFATPAQLWPSSLTLDNYRAALRPEFGGYLFNSVVVSALTIVISTGLGFLGAFGLQRFRGRLRLGLLAFLIAGQMVPAAAIIIPIFAGARELGLINSRPGLALAYVALTLPVATIMQYTFLSGLPEEVFEAAHIDGASTWQLLRYVVAPMAVPGLVSAAVWLAVLVWQEFLFALSMTTTKETWTLPVGLSDFIGQYGIRYGELMATSIVMSIPVVVVFLLLQRHLVQGITAGAVKG
ncbi:carbohydrate ABC transporter permease [Propionibacteriaceae bacterium Y2011]